MTAPLYVAFTNNFSTFNGMPKNRITLVMVTQKNVHCMFIYSLSKNRLFLIVHRTYVMVYPYLVCKRISVVRTVTVHGCPFRPIFIYECEFSGCWTKMDIHRSLCVRRVEHLLKTDSVSANKLKVSLIRINYTADVK